MKLPIIFIAIFCTLAQSDDIMKRKTSEYCFKRYDNIRVRLEKIREDFYIKKGDVIHLPEEYKFCKWSSSNVNAEISLDENLVLEASYGTSTTSRKTEKYDSTFISDPFTFSCFLPDLALDGKKDILDEMDDIKCSRLVMKPFSGRECGEENSLDKFLISKKKECEKYPVKENIESETECEEYEYEEKEEESKKYNDIFLPILKKSIGKIFVADIAVSVRFPGTTNDTNYNERKILKIKRPIVIIGECSKKNKSEK